MTLAPARPTDPAGEPAEPDAKRCSISNGVLRLTVDDRGRLHELVELRSGHDYAGSGQAGGLLWKLFLERDGYFQIEAACTDVAAELEADGDTLTLRVESVRTARGEEAISVEVRAELVGDEVRWSLGLDNRTERTIVKEAHFPLLSGLNLPADHELITTAYGGCRHPSPEGFVRERYPDAHQSWYTNNDAEGLQVQHLYPGSDAAMNCFAFAGPGRGLYVGSHDPEFRNTVHLWRLRGEALDAGLVKHLFLEPGASVRVGGYVVSPYRGSWHAAADKYQAWTRTWNHTHPRPSHMDDFNGWQRLIYRHQNGDDLFCYQDTPRVFEDGVAAGIDTLFLFGWWEGGFDRAYPDYTAIEEQGGAAELKEQIRAFQEDRGGSVYLYFSGRTVDRQSAFYREKGQALSIKGRSGAEARDSYLFSNQATFERLYGAVELVPMCLETRGWQEELRRMVDLAVDYGCKGVFFDQLGLQERPCCDRTHGHAVPSVDQFKGKREAIAALRAYAREKDPEMCFGVEIFCDAVSQHVDYVHGLFHQRNVAKNQDYRERGERPRFDGFIDWHRYVFPDLLISDRDIRDERDFERLVNFALLRGMVHDVEIHRCRKTIAATPNYQAYLAEASALRRRHPGLLMRGTYRDTLGFSIDNDEVDARAAADADRLAVLLTQSHLEHAETTLRVPGFRVTGGDGIGGYAVEAAGGGEARVRLGRHAVAVVFLEKEAGA